MAKQIVGISIGEHFQNLLFRPVRTPFQLAGLRNLLVLNCHLFHKSVNNSTVAGRCPAYWRPGFSSRTLVGSAVMPIGVLEMNPAIPHAALSTTPLSRGFTGHLLLRNSLAEPFFRLLRKLFHGELPQIGSPECMGLMIPQAGATIELFGRPPFAKRH
jgi:hypothetical protein